MTRYFYRYQNICPCDLAFVGIGHYRGHCVSQTHLFLVLSNLWIFKLILICIIQCLSGKTYIYFGYIFLMFFISSQALSFRGASPPPLSHYQYLKWPQDPSPHVCAPPPPWQFLATAPVRELFQSTQYMHIDWPNVTWLIGYYKIHHFIYRAVLRMNK